MNASLPQSGHAGCLVDLALAAFQRALVEPSADGAPVLPGAASEGWRQWLRAAPLFDEVLRDLAIQHQLSRVELVALALTAAAETDARVAHALAGLQAPAARGAPPGPRRAPW